MKKVFHAGRTVPVLLILGIMLTVGLWQGCDQQQSSPTKPDPALQSEQGMLFSKENPVVKAAMDIQNRHTERLMGNPEVIGTGVGADEKGAPVILLLTKREGVQDLPSTLEGIKTRVQVVGEVTAMAGYTKQYTPVPCGVSVGNAIECAAGTIGCLVEKGGTRYMLSNNHVFARENAASTGERINQPGRYDGKPRCAQTRAVGTLSDFEPIQFGSGSTNTIDAAIAICTSGVQFTGKMVNNLYTLSSSPVSPSVGLAVKKVGRTSGLTTGTISGINVTISVQYSGGIARFFNQIMVNGSFIRSGDSGSLMVTQNGNNPVGLNFAGGSGGSFANPIVPVLNRFNATVSTSP